MEKVINCPICGAKQECLNLEETSGWFECTECKNKVQLCEYAKTVRVPIYDAKMLAKIFKDAPSVAEMLKKKNQ